MLEICRQCGGDLRMEATGYKCTCCGVRYESLEELHPERRNYQSNPSQAAMKSKYANLEQYDNGVDVFDNNVKAVLEITWSDERYLRSGSGFLVSRDGYAITNTHVVTYEDGRSCVPQL